MRIATGTVALACATVLALVGAAEAGTKWQTNLIGANATDPTIEPTSKISFKDKGLVKASIKGLTDAMGAPVTTDGSFKKTGFINGDEYIVILSGLFTALSIDFEFNLLFEAKAGKGSGKLDAGSLFSLIPMGTYRGVEITGARVVGPLGAANVGDCGINVAAGGFVILGATNPCDHGDTVGVAGVLIP